MNYYETLYIVHPALESGRLKDIILSLEESLKNLGGKTLSIDIWGKKRLAYLIDKQKYGTYVQLQFTGEGNCISSFRIELEHNPNILSYLTTIIEESDVIKPEKDLDTQIAGQSRDAQRINEDSSNSNKKTTPEHKNSVENDGTTTTETEVPVGKEKPIEANSKEESSVGTVKDDSSNKSEAEKTEESENNTDNVEETPGNEDEISPVNEEE